MNIRLPINKQNKEWLHKNIYLLSPFDKQEKEKHVFKGQDGEDYMLHIPAENINNSSIAFPTTGVVVGSFGDDPDFLPGDMVVCEQNVFRVQDRKNVKWNVFYDDPENGELFRAFPIDVFLRINPDRTMTPRRGILICENVYKQNYTTVLDLELPESAKVKRRDMVKVYQTWEGEDCEYSAGDLLLIERSADWRFMHDGKEYIVIDHYFNDVIAVVDDQGWEKSKIDHTHY